MSPVIHRIALFFALAALCLAPAQTPIGSTTNGGTSGTVPVQFAQGAWTPYVPTTTNLTSVTAVGAGFQAGKTAGFRFQITGTGNGSVPLISVPYPMVSLFQTFACTGNNSVIFVTMQSIGATATTLSVSKYDASGPTNAVVWIIVCEGVYETT